MSIFEQESYKSLLKSFISSLPKKGRGEINRIAEHLRVHPTLVSQVLNGERDFSTEQAHKLCGYMGLSPLETDYFILLLEHERAGTNELKQYYKKKIEQLKKSSLSVANRIEKHRSLSELERSVFYSSWIYMAIWLQTSVDDGQSLEAIAQKLSISRALTAEYLGFLKNAQLCEEKDGIYKMLSQHIHLNFGSPFLARHHSNWRIKSLQRAEDLVEEELMFTSPFSVSRKDFSRIREELIKIIKETSAIIKDSPAEDIACMNLDLFWIKK